MSLRRYSVLTAAIATAAASLVSQMASAELPDGLGDDWYHVELLIFAREDAGSLAAEQWEPLPELAYPDDYRYLVDPERAERRVAESLALESVIDARGVQTLTVPAPVSLLDNSPRPDSEINEPFVAEDPNLPLLIGTDPNDVPMPPEDEAATLTEGGGDEPQADSADDRLAPAIEEEEAPEVLLALPDMLLSDSELAFRNQARTLRRRGERVLFHGHWWSRLPEDGETLPLVLDRSSDPDASDWPALQGSVHLYRSRFLHIDVDLWLNTMASYLPAGWQIDPAPLPEPSLLSKTLQNEPFDPWAPAPPPEELAPAMPVDDMPPVDPWNPAPTTEEFSTSRMAPATPERDAGVGSEQSAGDDAPEAEGPEDEESEAEGPEYPWRHAITHRQSRRMRSGETHYLDHPVLGIVVRLRPAGDELLPFADDEDLAFRERHGLPADYLLLPPVDGD